MPIMREIGPVIMDESVATLAEQLTKLNPVVFGKVMLISADHPKLS